MGKDEEFTTDDGRIFESIEDAEKRMFAALKKSGIVPLDKKATDKETASAKEDDVIPADKFVNFFDDSDENVARLIVEIKKELDK